MRAIAKSWPKPPSEASLSRSADGAPHNVALRVDADTPPRCGVEHPALLADFVDVLTRWRRGAGEQGDWSGWQRANVFDDIYRPRPLPPLNPLRWA